MQPIGVVWNNLPMVVRDLAPSAGKQILLEMDGADTEFDKPIIEASSRATSIWTSASAAAPDTDDVHVGRIGI
jgi:hypothetical protein